MASIPSTILDIGRGQAQRGTNSCFAYATAYLISSANGSTWP